MPSLSTRNIDGCLVSHLHCTSCIFVGCARVDINSSNVTMDMDHGPWPSMYMEPPGSANARVAWRAGTARREFDHHLKLASSAETAQIPDFVSNVRRCIPTR